jgi:hypothetical protein
LEDFQRAKGLQFSGRLAMLSLFGMINWIYTWHNPRVDAGAQGLARQMGDIFFYGVLNVGRGQRKTKQSALSSQQSAKPGSTLDARRENNLPASKKKVKRLNAEC